MMRSLKGLSAAVGMLVATSVVPNLLLAQVNQARLSGTVTDQSGGVIAGATVTITDVQKNVSRTLTADSAGEYVAPNLDPSTYRLHVEYRGFKTFTRENIQLGVGQDARADVTLEPGEQSQSVTVTEALPLVETTTATLTASLSTQTINDLPLNGRNYIDLLTLRPGYVNAPGAGATKQTAMGMRELDNFYLVDGINNYDWATGQEIINGYTLAGDAATILPVDAIQEVNTEQLPKAEFGWKPGMQVNIGLKSGTNQLHGSAYAFGRDGAWDAKNFFQPTDLPKPPLSVEQYGATAGGPLVKDKVFWFLGFEAQNLNVGGTSIISSPVDAPIGDVSLSIVDACNAVGRANVTPLSAQLAGLPAGSCTPSPATASFENLFPTNLGTEIPGSPQQVVPSGLFSLNSSNGTYSGLAKVDYHLSETSTLSGMFFIGQDYGTWVDNPGAITAPWSETNLPFRNRIGTGAWTWTPNSQWVNEAKVGYTHVYAPDLSADRNANPAAPWGLSNGIPTGYGINTGVTNSTFYGLPLIYISGFTNLGGGNWPRFVGPNSYTEILDQVSYLRGKHAFKFGGEVNLVGSTGGDVHSLKGRINFRPDDPSVGTNTALENFLLGNAGNGSAIFVGDPVRHVHDQDYAFFVQDDYRVLPRLTVNLGLRYELQTVITEQNNLLGNFDPNSTTGFVQVGKGESSAYNGDHNNFSPRVGFAWDLQGNGKTAIRGSASILHEFVQLAGFMSSGGGLGTVPTGAQLCQPVGTPPIETCVQGSGTISGAEVTPPPSGPNSLSTAWQSNGATPIFANAGVLTCSDVAPCATPAFSRNLETPYFETWSLDVQRMLTNNLSLEVGYLGNHGVKLLGLADLNAPALGSGGTPTPYLAKFRYLSYINQMSNLFRSHYNAMQVVLTQRASHGLSFTATYVYSHATDDNSSNDVCCIPLNNANPDLMYGNSDYDLRHHFTLDVTYTVPGRKSPGQILEGWEIAGIATLQTGMPWGVEDFTNDFSQTGEVNNPYTYGEEWNFYGKAKDFQASPNGIPFFQPGTPPPGDPAGPTDPAFAINNPICTAHAGAPGSATYNSMLNIGCYTSGSSALLPPAPGTFGTVGRNNFSNPPFKVVDFSVFKNWKFKERLTAQFRAEFFNVFNHPVFGGVDAGHLAANDPSVQSNSFGASNATADVAAGDPVMGSGSNRDIQLGLKLTW
jgi:Carboxypeptidase regulatory-like domain/TonB dependent receptor